MIVGIDPGIEGAAAVLCPAQSGKPAYVAEIIDLPTKPDGDRRQLDAERLSHWIKVVNPSRIVVEQVGPMPLDGRKAAFRFGMAVGIIHTVCRLRGVEPELVSPLVWKAYYCLLSMDKEASLRKARVLFPRERPRLMLKKHHNRAEALLIARWAARPPIGRDW